MSNPFAKTAGKPYVAGPSPEYAAQNNEAKAEALRKILRSGLLGLGLGAGSSALLALPGMMRGNPIPGSNAETDVELPYPQPINKLANLGLDAGLSIGAGALGVGGAEKQRAADPVEGALYGGAQGATQGLASVPGALGGQMAGGAIAKRLGEATRLRRFAGGAAPLAGAVAGSMAGWAAGKPIANAMTGSKPKPKPEKKEKKEEKKADFANTVINNTIPTKPGQKSTGAGGWLRGDTHNNPDAIPWQMPGTVLAGAGGALGGTALVHYLLKKHRKSNLDSELAKAQQEYDEAMLSQYNPDKLRKLSSVKAASSTTNLDVCFDALEKQGLLDKLNDAAGMGAGAYLTLASLLGLGTAVGTKKWLDGRSGENTMTEALKRRAMIRNLQNPPDVHVKPVPVEYVNGQE